MKFRIPGLRTAENFPLRQSYPFWNHTQKRNWLTIWRFLPLFYVAGYVLYLDSDYGVWPSLFWVFKLPPLKMSLREWIELIYKCFVSIFPILSGPTNSKIGIWIKGQKNYMVPDPKPMRNAARSKVASSPSTLVSGREKCEFHVKSSHRHTQLW